MDIPSLLVFRARILSKSHNSVGDKHVESTPTFSCPSDQWDSDRMPCPQGFLIPAANCVEHITTSYYNKTSDTYPISANDTRRKFKQCNAGGQSKELTDLHVGRLSHLGPVTLKKFESQQRERYFWELKYQRKVRTHLDIKQMSTVKVCVLSIIVKYLCHSFTSTHLRRSKNLMESRRSDTIRILTCILIRDLISTAWPHTL